MIKFKKFSAKNGGAQLANADLPTERMVTELVSDKQIKELYTDHLKATVLIISPHRIHQKHYKTQFFLNRNLA